MNINYHPESCPRCGVNFREYCDGLKEDFEEKHAAELARIRSEARPKGIVKGFIKGLVVATILISLSWNEPGAVDYWGHMQNFFSENPIFVSIVYIVVLFLFVLIDGVGKVNSRKEQQMWEQFLQKQSQADYLQSIL